jgi:hypothetical protein
MENFEVFWNLFDPDPEFNNRQRACRALWEQKGEQQRHAILEFLKSGKQRSSRNPYYFIADFRVRSPQVMSYADYYAKYGTTLEQDGWKMANPTGNQVIYVR